MERVKYVVSVLICALCVVTLSCLMVFVAADSADKAPEPYRDTIRTTFVDTIPYYLPVPKDSTVIKYVTVRVEAVGKEKDFPTTDDHFRDTTQMVTPDSAEVVVPITQKVYEDSAYTAYVSGYMASLDSLMLRAPREVVTIKERKRPKRWSISVQGGYGMTLKGTPQFVPYVGVGVSYNLFSFDITWK